MSRWIAWIWIAALCLFMLFASHHAAEHDLSRTLHWGYDAFGRSLFHLTLLAGRESFLFAFIAAITSLAAGISLGTFMAVSPSWIKFSLKRILDFFLAFPSLLLALSWSAVHGPGWDTLLISLALGTLPGTVRLMNARAEEILIENYVQASAALGATRYHLIWNHLLPELSSLCAVKFPNLFCQALMAEATLSFLGIGAPIGSDTWGALISQSQNYLLEAPHIALMTGVPLILTTLALQKISQEVTTRPEQKRMVHSRS